MRLAWIPRLLLAVGVTVGAMFSGATPAGAHPLGNFTTNRHSRIEVGASVVRVHYVLDEAELVAFRQREALAREGTASYVERRVAELRSGLRLSLDGRAVSLRIVDSALAQPAGQGGLTTLRIEAVFEAALPAAGDGAVVVSFDDSNGPDLLGWREIVVSPAAGTRLVDAGEVPTKDRSDELRSYPADPGVAPLDIRSVRFEVVPGSGRDAVASIEERTVAGGSVGGDRFVRLLASTTSSPIAVGGAVLTAFAFGLLHAVGPGHGKTVMAAYLVSTQGRRRDALALGGIVSLMHTASVLALAGVLATVGRRLDAARLYPALTVVAGILVAGVGLRLVARRWPTRPTAPPHGHHHHDHDGEHEEHEHHGQDHGGHVHGPGGHSHELPAEVRPLSRAGLIALGTSGGLFPSPSAVVVLVGAFAVGRAALGLALIAAFSVGLAAMLVTVGLLLVAGRDRVQRSRFVVRQPWLSVAGAGAIALLGTVLVAQGLLQLLERVR